MPIIFGKEESRNQLLNKGIVYTFRRNPRKTIGKDWATDKRGGKKIADVYISLEGRLPLENLEPYVAQSGFTTLDEWIKAIKELNPEMVGTTGWLYKVIRLRTVLMNV